MIATATTTQIHQLLELPDEELGVGEGADETVKWATAEARVPFSSVTFTPTQ